VICAGSWWTCPSQPRCWPGAGRCRAESGRARSTSGAGQRLLPLALLVLLIAAVAPGTGFVFLALLQGFLVFLLLAGVMGLLAAHRLRRRMRQHWQLTRGHYQPWGGYQL
jgi:hypothetical protein